ncbi:MULTISPECIES: hypothetical protein [unclassified Synechococcus]|uniref:hypothetical protein n=1 Tax=unclassified Synechococcus TaxID=2626047 RepID=UPI000069958F|nr:MULTISPECIES: hypothetical protein [unclassified Synechococcus]EAQ74387.1 hypothetical protein WH5701_07156 [Synechococcus sp. WH 5701]WFN60162.1 hypothetical protein N4320_06250 [Synechococcus sp. CCFWC 502]
MIALALSLLVVGLTAFALPAQASYFWYGGITDGPFYPGGGSTGYSDITFWWSSSNADDYDRYRLCWRQKSNTEDGKDPCDYDSVVSTLPEVQFDAQNQTILANTTYKFRLKAHKRRNDKWKTLTSTIVNPCFWAGGGGPGSLHLSCSNNPND